MFAMTGTKGGLSLSTSKRDRIILFLADVVRRKQKAKENLKDHIIDIDACIGVWSSGLNLLECLCSDVRNGEIARVLAF